jgi:hypothetical protein
MVKLLLLIAILAAIPALAPAGSKVPDLPTPPPVAPAKPPAGISFLEKIAPPPAPRAEFSGSYWCHQDGSLHTWEFRDDHTFEHTWTASARNAEGGTFHLNSAGNFVLLEVTSPAAKPQFHRMRIQFVKDGLVLDQIELKLKLQI